MDQDEVRRLFEYDAETGVMRNRVFRNPKALKGEVAGTINRSLNCRQVCVNYQVQYVHRLIWIYAHGPIPASMSIDHINGDPTDNRLVNLRLATHLQNMRNVKRPTHNTSGYKGVSWHRRDRRWRAQIKTGKVTKFLGNFTSKEEAASAYNMAAQRMFGEFARLNEVTN